MKVRLQNKENNSALAGGITLLESGDAHWYTSPALSKRAKGRYVPSVSTILGLLKDGLEFVNPYELKEAARRGRRIHKASEVLEEGQTIDREYGRLLEGGFPFTDREWLMLLGFQRWFNEFQPKPLFIETKLADAKLGYGGSLDRIYDIGGRIVLVDIKTTSVIQGKHWMQVAAYRELALKMKLVPEIHETAILRLADKTKKGYQYEAVGEEATKINARAFSSLLQVHQHLNPSAQPTILDLPDTIQLIVPTV